MRLFVIFCTSNTIKALLMGPLQCLSLFFRCCWMCESLRKSEQSGAALPILVRKRRHCHMVGYWGLSSPRESEKSSEESVWETQRAVSRECRFVGDIESDSLGCRSLHVADRVMVTVIGSGAIDLRVGLGWFPQLPYWQ